MIRKFNHGLNSIFVNTDIFDNAIEAWDEEKRSIEIQNTLDLTSYDENKHITSMKTFYPDELMENDVFISPMMRNTHNVHVGKIIFREGIFFILEVIEYEYSNNCFKKIYGTAKYVVINRGR